MEQVELTNMCMIKREDYVLMQHRIDSKWPGMVFPGGHLQKGESVVDSVIREIKEETGLTIINPNLCGIKQFNQDGHRYMVFLFTATQFYGKIKDSDEGKVEWIKFEDIYTYPIAKGFEDMINVFVDEEINELFYTDSGKRIYK